MPYGEKLKLIKKERGLTNSAISKMCNVSLATVTRLFDEKNLSGNFETFVALAKGLEFSLDELAGLKPPDKSIDDIHKSYSEQLSKKDTTIAEKDKLIAEKDAIIKEIKEEYRKERKEKHHLSSVFAIFAIALLAVLALDLLHGHFGYFQY